MFQIFIFESVLKISEHVEICNLHVESILKKSVENYKKACWNFQHVLKTVKKHVENFRMFWKL